MPIWCGDWPQDQPIPVDTIETTCDAILGPDGRLYHWANYADFRRTLYPSIADQLDAVYKALSYLSDNGIDIGKDGLDWIKQIKAVKDKYPKSS